MVFETHLKKYEQELLQNVIPFWEKYSIDSKYGGYIDSIDRDGSMIDSDKWMWMNFRKVYMWATLGELYKNNTWIQYAKQGWDFLTTHGKDENGMYYFALNRQGEPILAPSNIYSESFAMMGSAGLYKATQETKYKEEALSAMNHYLARMDNPKGPWEKSMPARKKRLSLGVYMIFANLGNVMKDCLQNNDYDIKIAESVNMVVEHFWNEEHGVLFENINPDYTFDLESYDGRHINPGHGLETCWFILQYAERNNRADLIPKVAKMIKGILNFGWDPQYGGILYFMDVLDKPHLELQWDMKLWWVHNEAILATLFAYRLTGDREFLEWFYKLDDYSFKHFSDPEFGEWFAYLNRQGEPTHMLKGGKWKCFFHLPRFLLMSMEQMKLIDTKNPSKGPVKRTKKTL
jgi:N-acylglucosamine 2-epimerase